MTPLGIVLATVLLVVFCVRTAHEPSATSPPGCPALVPNTNDAATDYIDMFVWDHTYYWNDWAKLEAPPRLGQQVTTVGCSISELTAANHLQVEQLPWADRTATFLRSGSPVYAIRGVPHHCQVAIHDGPDWKIYTAHLDTGRPVACG